MSTVSAPWMDGQALLASLWWGPLRRPVEALARRVCSRRQTIISGSLRGFSFEGGTAHMLGIYEYPLQQLLMGMIESGQVFFDIGAHVGFMTLLASRAVGRDGLVVSCEPHPANARSLRNALQSNRISNVIVLEVAVGSRSGKSRLLTEGLPTTQARLSSAEDEHAGVAVEVMCVDEIANLYGWPDVVKVDVEGHESAVLEGATRVMSSARRPAWLIETHSAEQLDKCHQTMRTRGLTLQNLNRPKNRPEFPRHTLAWPAGVEGQPNRTSDF